MASKLAIVAIAGLSISLVSWAAAGVIGGPALWDEFQNWNWRFGDNDAGKPRCNFGSQAASSSRTLSWSNDDTITVALPANARYRPGTGGSELLLKGDAQILEHVQVRRGRIELDCRLRDESRRIDITLPGRDFREFHADNGARLILEEISQASLELSTSDSSSIEASGGVDDLDVSLHGSGNARLAKLTARNLDLSVAGGGTADIAPTDSADISIAGSGLARLAEPVAAMKTLSVSIAGSGKVEGAGNAETLEISIAGSGDARLGELKVKRAEISIAGSGDADIAPSERAEISIMGSGNVRLHAEPASINTHIAGSGNVEHRAKQMSNQGSQ